MIAAQRSAVSPFPGVVKKRSSAIDSSMLRVEHNTKPPVCARVVHSKYAELFAQIKAGSCVVCEPIEAASVAQALRKYLEKKGKPLVIRLVSRCEDGHGRVWALAQPK